MEPTWIEQKLNLFVLVLPKRESRWEIRWNWNQLNTTKKLLKIPNRILALFETSSCRSKNLLPPFTNSPSKLCMANYSYLLTCRPSLSILCPNTSFTLMQQSFATPPPTTTTDDNNSSCIFSHGIRQDSWLPLRELTYLFPDSHTLVRVRVQVLSLNNAVWVFSFSNFCCCTSWYCT